VVTGTRSASRETDLPFIRREFWQSEATAMFSLIFEVHPTQEKFDLYLDLAKGLKPTLEGIDGFIDNERFESIRPAGLDPVALNLARREIRGEVADGREASRHPAARPGLGVSGLPFAGG
jgi:hypothetical protein